MQEDRYVQTIRELLHKKRFDHSLNVAQRAVELAKRYGEDEQKAYIAGILHDICKNMQPEEQLQWMKKSAIILDENLLEQPPVWHGFAGAEYIRQQLGIEDEDIINAVRYHTVARAGMSRLEQIIYLADFISADRHYKDVETMRAKVDEGLEPGMFYALTYTITDLARQGRPIHPDTVDAYNWVLERRG